VPDWDWALEGTLAAAGSLVFVRGVPLERVIEAYEMRPADALLVPRERAGEALRYPVTVERHTIIHPWIRAGVTGEWAFAICETWNGLDAAAGEFAGNLSAGTELVWVSWADERSTSFDYTVDGEPITWFDAAQPWNRFCREPDRFVTWMREAGLAIDRPRHEETPRQPRIALLEMLTLAWESGWTGRPPSARC
jgi:hypothetical protein